MGKTSEELQVASNSKVHSLEILLRRSEVEKS